MSDLTNAKLDELAAIESKAAPNWIACCDRCDVLFGDGGEAYVAIMCCPETADPAYAPETRKANREFMVALRNAAPALIAAAHERNRLVEENERLRQKLLDAHRQLHEGVIDVADNFGLQTACRPLKEALTQLDRLLCPYLDQMECNRSGGLQRTATKPA